MVDQAGNPNNSEIPARGRSLMVHNSQPQCTKERQFPTQYMTITNATLGREQGRVDDRAAREALFRIRLL